jgi:hypothetical protein
MSDLAISHSLSSRVWSGSTPDSLRKTIYLARLASYSSGHRHRCRGQTGYPTPIPGSDPESIDKNLTSKVCKAWFATRTFLCRKTKYGRTIARVPWESFGAPSRPHNPPAKIATYRVLRPLAARTHVTQGASRFTTLALVSASRSGRARINRIPGDS